MYDWFEYTKQYRWKCWNCFLFSDKLLGNLFRNYYVWWFLTNYISFVFFIIFYEKFHIMNLEYCTEHLKY